MWIHCSINLVFGAEKKAFMAADDDILSIEALQRLITTPNVQLGGWR